MAINGFLSFPSSERCSPTRMNTFILDYSITIPLISRSVLYPQVRQAAPNSVLSNYNQAIMKVSYFILFVALFGSGISKAQITYTGKQPGRARVIAGAGKLVLENEVLRMEFLQANRQLYLSSFEDRQAGKKLALPPQHPLFICTLRDGTALSSLDFVAGDKVQVADLAPVADDPVFSSGLAGKKLSVSFTHEGRGLTVHWRAELRDGSNYVKQFLYLATKDSIHIEKITTINLPA